MMIRNGQSVFDLPVRYAPFTDMKHSILKTVQQLPAVPAHTGTRLLCLSLAAAAAVGISAALNYGKK
jgi:hypothetical protein